MNFLFAAQNSGALHRASNLIGGLMSEGHRITIKIDPERFNSLTFKKSLLFSLNKIGSFEELHQQIDMVFYGLYGNDLIPESDLKFLHNTKTKLAIFQNDDFSQISLERIPLEIQQKAALFLRNHWPSNIKAIPKSIVAKTGFMNSLLGRCHSASGADLKNRSKDVSFFGTNTGIMESNNSREKAIRMLRGAKLELTGGITDHPHYPAAVDISTRRISYKQHEKVLSDSKISIALWGHCPLTYRFFESLSRRCLVIAQDFSSLKFAAGPLEPFLHFIPVKQDLSDLVEKVTYYLEHRDEAQQIANDGFAFFKKYYDYKGLSYPQGLMDEITSSWKSHYAQAEQNKFQKRCIRLMACFKKCI